EKRLMKKLFTDYSTQIRPVQSPNTSLSIYMEYVIKTLHNINEKDQTITTFGWLMMKWIDEYLIWNISEYKVDNLVLESSKIWLPDLLVRNSIDNINGELFGSSKYKAIVYSNGSVSYATAGKTSTLCGLDMTYFPFDTQFCDIHIDSWTYTDSQVQIRRKTKKLDISSYRYNGIWDLIDTEVHPYSEYNNSQIKFCMRWKRCPVYHITSILIPCSIMSIITLFVFLLPPDSGEKISLSITVLLSFTVFQISVEEKLPERSDNRPLLAIYILATMVLTALSLLCTIIVLTLHHQNYHSPPPKWLKCFVLDWVRKLLFRKEPMAYRSSSKIRRQFGHKKKDYRKEMKQEEHSKHCVNAIYMKMMKDADTEKMKTEWMRIAMVFDRVFGVLFTICIMSLNVTTFCMLIFVAPDAKQKIRCDQHDLG
ncbi:hypothetical protein HELRODRAFT_62259, partial [Helobdella robusta]|uniref:Neurotransmitter-gated ion-channel ligand-binding domain-containing protein n=1 Tax=Helobdella robusta TaxID=6412 RepID=T1FWX9_HELRO